MPSPPAPQGARSLQRNVAWALVGSLGYRGATLSLILAVAVAKSFEAVSELVFGLLQRAEDMRRIAVSMLAKGTVSVLAVGVVLKLTGSLVLATLAMAVCWGSVLAVYDLPAAVRLTTIRPSLALGSLGGLTWVALPLGCVAGLGSLTFNVPRYAIEARIDPGALRPGSADRGVRSGIRRVRPDPRVARGGNGHRLSRHRPRQCGHRGPALAGAAPDRAAEPRDLHPRELPPRATLWAARRGVGG